MPFFVARLFHLPSYNGWKAVVDWQDRSTDCNSKYFGTLGTLLDVVKDLIQQCRNSWNQPANVYFDAATRSGFHADTVLLLYFELRFEGEKPVVILNRYFFEQAKGYTTYHNLQQAFYAFLSDWSKLTPEQLNYPCTLE